MKLDRSQIVALIVLTLLALTAIALLRDEALNLLNIENSKIVIPAENN